MNHGTARRHGAELIVISDDKGRSALPETIGDVSIRMIDWQDIGGLSSLSDAHILLDVDLRDMSKVKRIKDKLPIRSGGNCRIIAVDRRSHRCQAQANGLGASDLLSQPLDIHELTALLQRCFSQGQGEQGAPSRTDHPALKVQPGGASIVSAAAGLDHLFTALTGGKQLDLAAVAQSGDQVIDGLTEVGLEKWLDTVRRYHEGTFQHCLLVTGVLTAFGRENGMRRSDVLTLTIAGLLHDVGKAQVPCEILDKPGKLTDEEFALIKRHPVLGFDYLCTQNNLTPEVLKAVRHHHEYLDGSGYPDGLLAQQIDDLTRVVTICDVYGALLERRAYKAPMSSEMALDILTGMAKDGKVEYGLVKALRSSVLA
ncbi:MAG: HD-GYP domain-containing protein [Xanthobacteraceae bacterium]